MTWRDVAIAGISACQVIALAALAIVMEHTRRRSSRNHAEVVQALATNHTDESGPQQP